MTQAFDPYHKWLGIAPKDQPPNHYRLLGIEMFEDDADVISAAAERQMMHLHSLKLGSRIELSQRLLNEVAAARVCLLKPEEKAEYDSRLRGALAPLPPVLKNDAPAPLLALPFATRVMPVASPATLEEPINRPLRLIGMVVAVSAIGFISLIFGGWVAFRTTGSVRGNGSPAELAKVSGNGRPAPLADPVRVDATQPTSDITPAAGWSEPEAAKSIRPMPTMSPSTLSDSSAVNSPEERSGIPPISKPDGLDAGRAAVASAAESRNDLAALHGKWNVYFCLPTDTIFDIAADGSVAFTSFLSTARRGRLRQDGDAALLLWGDEAFARLRLEHGMLLVDQFGMAGDWPMRLGVGVGARADGARSAQEEGLPTSFQSGAGDIWDDFDLHGNSVAEEFVRLTSTAISTKQCFSGPIEVSVVARTDKDNIRICAYGHAGLIFNWEVAPNQLRGRRPDGSPFQYSTKPLTPNTWYQIRWKITETSFQAFVDGQLVFDDRGAYKLSASNPVWMPGGVHGSTVDVKSFTVTPLEAAPRDIRR